MSEPIVVVSGLPRSGTSMAMQALGAGGVGLYTDGERAADESNPNGYFECEKIKRLETDTAWLAEAEGKALKAVSVWLSWLPQWHDYKVVWMERDLWETLESMRRMCGEPEDIATAVPAWRALADRHKAFVREQTHMELCICQHREMIERPRVAVAGLAEFLDRPEFDIEAAAAVVDPRLHHHKRETMHIRSGP